MEKSLKPIYEMLVLHNKLFSIATADVSSEHANKRLNGKGNPFIHLAGHVTATRFYIANLLGLEAENPMGDVYNGDFDPDAERPPLKEVRGVFQDFAPKLLKQLDKVDSKHLAGDLPQQFPVEEQTILGGVSFLTEHEAYHIGQMGYQRVQLGYKSIYDAMFADAK